MEAKIQMLSSFSVYKIMELKEDIAYRSSQLNILMYSLRERELMKATY